MSTKPKDIVGKFLKLVEGKKLYILNNYSPFIQGSEWNTKKYFGKYYDKDPENDLIILAKEGDSIVVVTEETLINASKEIFQKYLKDKEFLNNRLDDFWGRFPKIDEIYNKYTYSRIKKTSWPVLKKLIQEIRGLCWEGNAIGYFSLVFDKDLCWSELQKSELKISKEEFEQIWETGIHPVNQSFDKEQFMHILRLFSEDKSWEVIAEECQYFYASYYNVQNIKDSELKLRKQYGGWKEKIKVLNETRKEEEHRKKELHDFKEWFGALNKEQQTIVNYLQTIIKIRDNRKNFFNKGLTIIWRIAQKLFNEAVISEDLIPFYTNQELLEGLDYLKKNKENLSRRKEGFIWFVPYNAPAEMEYGPIEDGKIKLNDYYLLSHNQSVEKIVEIVEIKGQTGAKGIKKGIVKVILDANKGTHFNNGDILVAGMTRPEYIPLMKKASAFITDEGGITCHAAIVAREMKKPCIIGTKIATKVLHDGDLVEVDADKGVVRILEKAGESVG